MSVKFIQTSLPGVLRVEPQVFEDHRGFFCEIYHQKKYVAGGIDLSFVQDSYSYSKQNTLRGLHYQLSHPQGKLLSVIRGEVFDVAVDIRRGSPTFGQWVGTHLTAENRHQIFVPEGFAHGFCVLSETADVLYKCTDFYEPEFERVVRWDDSDIAIDWPLLEETVAASPEWSFVFVGPAQCDEVERISSYPNVFLVDTQPHDRLPRYIDAFDVCLIPYQVNAYTENVYPVKMNEYLAMGKPVVSTPLREVKGFNDDHGPLVALADTAESFREAIAAELAGDDGAKAQDRYRAAEANSYVSRLREISALIETRIGERQSRPGLDREKAISSTAGAPLSRREAP